MLADAPGDRPHLDTMPGVRNRIAQAFAPLVRALRAELKLASADSDYIVPCRERVLPGDRIRCTVHGRAGYGFSTGDEKVRIEGEVQDVRGHFLVSVRITACPHDRGPSPGSVVRISSVHRGSLRPWRYREPVDRHDDLSAPTSTRFRCDVRRAEATRVPTSLRRQKIAGRAVSLSSNEGSSASGPAGA